jgi:hypothetical protein
MIEVKHITPDDPEYAEVVKSITPVHLVHKVSQKTAYLDAERSPSKMSVKRRSETVDKL